MISIYLIHDYRSIIDCIVFVLKMEILTNFNFWESQW